MDIKTLRVVRLCSENKTKCSVQAILNGEYNVLVITAGSLVELIKSKLLNINLFSVIIFDECHHCTGNHAYIQLIRQLRVSLATTSTTTSTSTATMTSLATRRPRIIGLTASPFPAKCFATGLKNLTELKQELDAVIFKPVIPITSNQRITWRIIDLSPNQQQFISMIINYLKDCATILNNLIGNEFIFLYDIDMRYYSKISGQVRLAKENFH